MPRSRNGRNIGGTGVFLRLAGGALAEPALDPLEIGLVARAQVLVADALAAGQERIGELARREAGIARDVLEPFGRVARRRLQPQHLDAPLGLVGGKRRARSSGWRPMARASAIASSSASLVPEPIEKCAECAASPISTTLPLDPALVGDARETSPSPDSLASSLPSAPGLSHGANRRRQKSSVCRGVGPVEPGGAPGLLAGLDDEGRGVLVEAVGVRLEPAPFGRDEDEGEGVEQAVRAEPDELVAAPVDLGLEVLGIGWRGCGC